MSFTQTQTRTRIRTHSDSHEEPIFSSSRSQQPSTSDSSLRKRRHSAYHPQTWAEWEAKTGALIDERLADFHAVFDQSLETAKHTLDDVQQKAQRAKELLRHKIDVAVKRARENGLIRYEDLPDPWKVNPHIVRGYRFSETKVECLRSVLGISNETVNIWSHLIGLIFLIATAIHFYPTSTTFSSSSRADIAIATGFFLAAAKCLVCSTMWHTMNSISDQPLMERFACVDYTGISLLVATSIMTTEYTAFYCDPLSRWSYMTLTLVLGIGGTILPWHPYFNKAENSWLRVAFFVSLALTGFVPIFQLSLTRGLYWASYFYAPILKSITVYFVGACLYAMKVPERWAPGVFDYVGGSHNIWHLAVLGGIFFHYLAMHDFFESAFQMAEAGACTVY